LPIKTEIPVLINVDQAILDKERDEERKFKQEKIKRLETAYHQAYPEKMEFDLMEETKNLAITFGKRFDPTWDPQDGLDDELIQSLSVDLKKLLLWYYRCNTVRKSLPQFMAENGIKDFQPEVRLGSKTFIQHVYQINKAINNYKARKSSLKQLATM